ncbi:LOB domain-containing protein 42 [Raphanus sativus]|nr:LOB domain-containing protein 42 [Raphanus sativus]
MRISCNGCRVLRKGCNQDCTIRPCLQWIKSADSQANATLFLAKFYGRAGLLNLIESGPDHLRPAIFRSLLYEACGRIVNPVDGSVGLMWSGIGPSAKQPLMPFSTAYPSLTRLFPVHPRRTRSFLLTGHTTYATWRKIQQQAVTVRRVWPLPHVSTSRHVATPEFWCNAWLWSVGVGERGKSKGDPLNQSSNLGCDDQVDTNEVGLELRLG